MLNSYYDSYCCFRNKHNSGYRILWELTTRCNEGCKFCHVQNTIELNTDQICQVFDKISNLNISDIIFTGGEPLLRKDIFEILEMAKKRKYSIDLCTNGTLINDSVAQKLKEYLSEISVSLDGSYAELYDGIRGVDNGFINVITGIKSLYKFGHDIHLTTVVTNRNYKDIKNIAMLGERLGAKSISYLGLITKFATNIQEALSIKMTNEQLDEIKKDILDLRKSGMRIAINSKRIFSNPCQEDCKAGRNILGITSDGKLLPCILIRSEQYINLREVESIDIDKLSLYNSNHNCI